MCGMDGLRIGRSLRAIRIQHRWRQADVAERANVSRSFISKVECGDIRSSDLGRLDHVCRALGADLDIRIRWRGEGLDRLLVLSDSPGGGIRRAPAGRLRVNRARTPRFAVG
jgi:transcriptional regulator with XRE-family HTH domain